MATGLRAVRLPSGDLIPVLGQGTWHLAETPNRRATELAALRYGIDVGMTLIDTAEMYAHGGAEQLVGEAIAGRRDEVFLVSKVLPHHATREGTLRACAGSLERLNTDRIDLYLLHWRGPVPLAETLDGFEALRSAGKIRNWGVSNFDTPDMEELMALRGGSDVATDQVLYNLGRRGPEYDLIPFCSDSGIPVMAYSPIEQGRILLNPVLRDLASRRGASPAQLALAWVLRVDNVCAIPRASQPDHIDEDFAALAIRLTDVELQALDAEFPPPLRREPLQML
jgi:diketogulonate reductase-like aldo/keto reductase